MSIGAFLCDMCVKWNVDFENGIISKCIITHFLLFMQRIFIVVSHSFFVFSAVDFHIGGFIALDFQFPVVGRECQF